jgi:hypothetical protein
VHELLVLVVLVARRHHHELAVVAALHVLPVIPEPNARTHRMERRPSSLLAGQS